MFRTALHRIAAGAFGLLLLISTAQAQLGSSGGLQVSPLTITIPVPSSPVKYTDGTALLQFLSSAEAGQPPSDTIGLGYSALANWTNSANGPSLALGPNTLKAETTGDHNVGIGNQALTACTTCQHNTIVGIDGAADSTAPTNSVGVGEHVWTESTTLVNGVSMGMNAGYHIVSSTRDTFLGFNAGQGTVTTSAVSADNTAVGNQSLLLLATGGTSQQNTAVGSKTGTALTTGSNNVLIGYNVGGGITTQNGSVLIQPSGTTNFASAGAVIIGGDVQGSASNGSNVIIGSQARGGGTDTVVGNNAGAAINRNNGLNSLFGTNAGQSQTNGTGLTAIGRDAAKLIAGGSSITVLGSQVGSATCTTGSDLILIGVSTALDCATNGESDTIRVGGTGGTIWKATGISTASTSVTTIAGKENVVSDTQLSGVLLVSATAPTIASGGCTTGSAQSVSASNGSAAFAITLGGATCGSTIVLTMPTASNGWVCDAHDITTPASNVIDQTAGGSATSVTLTNFVRTTGVAGSFHGPDVLAVKCTPY